jgi:hypothetical protein
MSTCKALQLQQEHQRIEYWTSIVLLGVKDYLCVKFWRKLGGPYQFLFLVRKPSILVLACSLLLKEKKMGVCIKSLSK